MLPPLHAFKVFEVVARLGHVGAAAAELHVTPGAVSQQLRSLQLHLGMDLFAKVGRRLVLTEAGLTLQQSVGVAMAEIGEGVRNLSAQRIDRRAEVVVNLCIPPVLGTTWLAPRLFAFMADHRHLRLNVATGVEFHAIDWRRSDVAIVYGNPPWPGFWWRMLHGVYLMPVCSPQLLRGPHAIRHPADVLHYRLLHEDDGSEWRRWLAQARVKYPGAADIYFGDFALILQAARDGHGVALVDDVISARDLDEGRLVQPLTQRVPAAKNYHCICSEETLAKPEIGALVDWLIDQASRTPVPRIGLG
ncbi:LysR substrate-binding domain-containing protein [Labrys sp. (in: a-proteobacteria)]|uniref:LysR substrate-binding domain-containing protein n=1 Tax=Labrys sp. (in: a-proteobacteria) TaxID=1917972 RepID=UPI0039E60AC9